MHVLGTTWDTEGKGSGNAAVTARAPAADLVFRDAFNSRSERLQQRRLEAPARKLATEVSADTRAQKQRGSRHL